VARTVKSNAWNEVFALILLGVGTLLFFALISYDVRQVPAHFLFSSSTAPSDTRNIMGLPGAIIAGFLFFCIGAASFLVAAVLLGLGAAKLFAPKSSIQKRLLWALVLIVAGASLLQLYPGSVRWMHYQFNAGPGGWIGDTVGNKFLTKALAIRRVGSGLLLLVVYVTSLILLTGLRPIHLVRQSVAGIRNGIVALREWQLKRRLRKSDLKGRLEISQQELAKQQRVIEKQLKKRGAPVPEPVAAVIPPEELMNRPKPKVVDTTALPDEPAKKKPSLAELRGAETKAKSPGGLTSKTWAAENYTLPGIDLLDVHDMEGRTAVDPAELEQIQQVLIETLGQFGIVVAAGDITKGPTITRYEVYPAKGVRVDKIVALERDLARATRAERINILAPIPGKDTVGIELANTRKVKVTLRELLQSQDWEDAKTKSKLPLALGKDVYGKTIIADLAQMPHLLVAGTTGSGKSVCINALVASMIFRFTPEELRFIMIDPKVVEMQMYNALPHLAFPVVTDPKKVLLALRWVIDEMEKRYKIFAHAGVRNITSFNGRPAKKTQKELDAVAGIDGPGEGNNATRSRPGSSIPATEIKVPRDDDPVIPERMPYIVIIIDELADLMQTAPADVESAIARITQMARAAGIHLIVATQTPRADVVTGVIKANIPSRIAFQVASKIDSRVILDENGADRLLGQGDMLYLPPSTSRLIRAQGVLVTDEEIHRLVEFVSAQSPPSFDVAMQDKLELSSAAAEDDVTEEDEELVEKCLEIIRQEKRASTSLLQRRLRLGYTRAARIVDILEQRGILGPGEGAKPREILVDLDAAV
jgi:S-DNA-T family DNA segregation ATPase FtsK/SpoIIIE